jgi:hypothetical protein
MAIMQEKELKNTFRLKIGTLFLFAHDMVLYIETIIVDKQVQHYRIQYNHAKFSAISMPQQ